MALAQKLTRLKSYDDLVLYKWMASGHRVADDYVMLCDLRLNTITCNEGKVLYSSAAPLLFMERHKPRIKLQDSNVLTVTDGPRRGINVDTHRFNENSEEAVPCRFCQHMEISEPEEVPKWLCHRILSMGNSPVYPVCKIIMPELFRVTKNPNSLIPVINKNLLTALDISADSGTDTIIEKFHDNLDLFGVYTEAGYIISNDLIVSGGCCVAASKGLSSRGGSAVHMMTKRSFDAEVSRRHWEITTK